MIDKTYDLAIIGGGIAGSAIARDAAGRGLSVYLCDKCDLAGGASSGTGRTLLSDGDLLEPDTSRAFLRQAEILLRNAPHAVRPLRVVMPLHPGPQAQFRRLRAAMRPATTSLFPAAARTALTPGSSDFKAEWQAAEEFSTCAVDDSRLVILNAVDARAHGALIEPRTRCLAARREGWFWKLTLKSAESGERWKIVARSLVNATGASAGDVLDGVIQEAMAPDLRLVKRSWIIVRRVLDRGRAYALPGRDGRMVFAIPHEGEFTLIGPAEVGYAGDPEGATVELDEIDALLDTVNAYLADPVGAESIAFVYASVCLQLTGRRASSGGDIVADAPPDLAPLVSVFGVRMATHRLLAEQVLAALADHVALGKPWTADAPLPGGHFAVNGKGDLVRGLRAAYPFVAEVDAERLVAAYGSRAVGILSGARRPEDLGRQFGNGLSEAELDHLVKEEWAVTAADVLWRRSKLGLRSSPADAAAIDQWMAPSRAPVAAPAA